MKVLIGVIFFIAIFWLIVTYSQNTPLHKLNTNPAPTTDKVIFPSSQDTLKKGQRYQLKWLGGGDSPIAIFLVNKEAEKQGVSVSLFDRVYNLQNTGSYKYTVPKNIPDGLYKFEIGDLNSDYFSISN